MDSLFKNLSDDDDSIFNSDVVDSNVKRSVGSTEAKEKGKKTISSRKEKRARLKIPVSKTTSKRKRATTIGKKRLDPSPKIAKTSGAPGSSTKGIGPSEKFFSFTEKGKELSRKAR